MNYEPKGWVELRLNRQLLTNLSFAWQPLHQIFAKAADLVFSSNDMKAWHIEGLGLCDCICPCRCPLTVGPCQLGPTCSTWCKLQPWHGVQNTSEVNERACCIIFWTRPPPPCITQVVQNGVVQLCKAVCAIASFYGNFCTWMGARWPYEFLRICPSSK